MRAAVAPVQALAISTQSSLACLPIMLKKTQQLGVQTATAEITLPMAVALLRATGPAMNIAVALYVANWFGADLTAGQYAVAIFAAVLTSMGARQSAGPGEFRDFDRAALPHPRRTGRTTGAADRCRDLA